MIQYGTVWNRLMLTKVYTSSWTTLKASKLVANSDSEHQLILINCFSLLLLLQLNICQFSWSFIYTIFIPKNDIVPMKYLEVPNTPLTQSQWRWPRLPHNPRGQTEQKQIPPPSFFFIPSFEFSGPLSFIHLTHPTKLPLLISVVSRSFKKKNKM